MSRELTAFVPLCLRFAGVSYWHSELELLGGGAQFTCYYFLTYYTYPPCCPMHMASSAGDLQSVFRASGMAEENECKWQLLGGKHCHICRLQRCRPLKSWMMADNRRCCLDKPRGSRLIPRSQPSALSDIDTEHIWATCRFFLSLTLLVSNLPSARLLALQPFRFLPRWLSMQDAVLKHAG